MTGTFTIDIDQRRNLLRITMSGFYEVADVQRYHSAVAAASTALACPPSQQCMVNDISAMQIQSQEIVAAFQSVMADPRYAKRRVGFIAASSLARSQLSRIIGSRTARIFATAKEAEAWLFDPAAVAAAAAA